MCDSCKFVSMFVKPTNASKCQANLTLEAINEEIVREFTSLGQNGVKIATLLMCWVLLLFVSYHIQNDFALVLCVTLCKLVCCKIMFYFIVDNKATGNAKDKRDFYFYVISIKGDWKYLKQTFLLSRYASCEQAVALKIIFVK